jgi:peptidoglycan/xylan/chitin deacetylase (PgdA/CDA1 family)
MTRLAAGVMLAVCCASCTRSQIDYPWDKRGVLCSAGLDDYRAEPAWDLIADSLDGAVEHGWVTLVYAHEPGKTVSIATLERVFGMAEERSLPFVTYREFGTAAPHGGIALAFDDDDVESWLSIRDLLATHGAHVTFFVTRWTQLTDEELEGIRLLAADGNDLEPHGVNHLHAKDYVAKHGLDAYMADEVLPSFAVLEAEGYPPTTFAYPFGEHDDAIDHAILAHVAHVRATRGPCHH